MKQMKKFLLWDKNKQRKLQAKGAFLIYTTIAIDAQALSGREQECNTAPNKIQISGWIINVLIGSNLNERISLVDRPGVIFLKNAWLRNTPGVLRRYAGVASRHFKIKLFNENF